MLTIEQLENNLAIHLRLAREACKRGNTSSENAHYAKIEEIEKVIQETRLGAPTPDQFREAARLILGSEANIERNETVALDKDGDAFVRIGPYPSRRYVFVLADEARSMAQTGWNFVTT